MRSVRMDIASYVFLGIATLVLAFAGLHGFHNKSITIISFGIGAILVIIGLCLFWQDAVWKHDNPPTSPPNELDKPPSPTLNVPKATPPHEPPVRTEPPFPRASPVTAPTATPETKSDTSHVDQITPEEVGRKLSEGSKRGKATEIKKALVGMRVNWKLFFWSASFPDDETVRVYLVSRNRGDTQAVDPVMVMCDLPKDGNERLPLTDQYVEFTTEGVVQEVGPADVVELKDVRLNRANPTESTPMKEQPHITTGNITSHNQGPGSFTGVNTGTVNLKDPPWALSDHNKAEMLTVLKESKVSKIKIWVIANDAVVDHMAKQISGMLIEAGVTWERTNVLLNRIQRGVTVRHVNDPAAKTKAEAIRKALALGDVGAELEEVDGKPDSPILIIVGVRP